MLVSCRVLDLPGMFRTTKNVDHLVDPDDQREKRWTFVTRNPVFILLQPFGIQQRVVDVAEILCWISSLIKAICVLMLPWWRTFKLLNTTL